MSSLLPTAVVSPIVSSTSDQLRIEAKDGTSTNENEKLALWKCKEKDWGGSPNSTNLLKSVSLKQASDCVDLRQSTLMQNASDYSVVNDCSVALDHIDESECDVATLTKLCTTDKIPKCSSTTAKRTSQRISNSRPSVLLNQCSNKFCHRPEVHLRTTKRKYRKRRLKYKPTISNEQNKNVLCEDKAMKSKELPLKAKLSSYPTRQKKLRICNDRRQHQVGRSVSSQTYNLFSYVPKIDDLLQSFLADVTVCAFCHLPANFLPGLGDLFGPCRPTYGELMERYDDAESKFSSSSTTEFRHKSLDTKPEICVDQGENTCYITTSCYKPTVKAHDNDSSFQCISGTDNNIRSMLPRMRMLQTVDCILNESNRKPAAKYSQAKKLHIPGFTGKITTACQQTGCRMEKNVDRNLLHNLNTIVFVEPTEQFLHSSSTSLNSTPTTRRKSKDCTSVDVVHKFDIKPIWVHAACAVWSPGVYCVKNQLFGIVTAVRDAADVTCTFCQRPGAAISCKYEKDKRYHYLCCKAAGLILDEETLTASSSV